MKFTRAELERFHGTTLPDVGGRDLRLLFVGINPGLWTAAVQAHFARRGNRFYPALFHAGIVGRVIDASAGYRSDDLAHLKDRGLGITNMVATASARAATTPSDDLKVGHHGHVLVFQVVAVEHEATFVVGESGDDGCLLGWA